MPIHQAGVILEGLHPTASITVNWCVIVESFPSVNTPLTVLATPSARFDPMALEIYSRALNRMPVAVPVRENGLGQWFSDLISEIEPFVTPIAAAINPALGMASKSIGVANKFYRDNYMVPSLAAPPNGPSMNSSASLRKKVKKKNDHLYYGSRGKKGNVMGPMENPAAMKGRARPKKK